jgi:plasmid stability protein
MPALLIKELPPELHQWLKQQAVSNHRSMNKQVIALLDACRLSAAPSARKVDMQAVDALVAQYRALPRSATPPRSIFATAWSMP